MMETSTQAGWRPDPDGVFESRWWDGHQWTDRVAAHGRQASSAPGDHPDRARRVLEALEGGPAAPPPPPPPGSAADQTRVDAPSGPRDDRALWAIVASPFLFVLVSAFLPEAAGRVVNLLVIGANVGLATADMAANPGLIPDDRTTRMRVWAGLLMPVYVWKRQTAARGSRLPFWGYLLSLLAGIVVAVMLTSGPAASDPQVIDGDALEAAIVAWVEERVGPGGIEVSCPDEQPLVDGRTFSCTVTVDGSDIPMDVTYDAESGDFLFEAS